MRNERGKPGRSLHAITLFEQRTGDDYLHTLDEFRPLFSKG